MKTLEEWINQYEEKTGDAFGIPKDNRLFFLAERGFSIERIVPESNMIFIYQVCGDGKFWFDFAKLQATMLGITRICTIVNREIKPYIRAMGGKILKEFVATGGSAGVFERRYIACDKIGRKIVFTHKCYNDCGNAEYWATFYLDEKVTPTDFEILKPKVGDVTNEV